MREVGNAPLVFSAWQRQQLAELQVVPEQIDELERVLPTCRAIRRNPAPMGEVRKDLIRLEKALRCASEELTRFEAAPDSEPALCEAFTRVQHEAFELSDRGEATTAAQMALLPALEAVSRALNALPREQRGPRAPWWPVARIHGALVLGWGRAYYPIRQGEAYSVVSAIAPAPPFPHLPSTGPTSLFRQVVGICYDLMDDDFMIDPERPIKAFVKWYRQDRRRRHGGVEGDEFDDGLSEA